jgi:hypothetical protein
MAIITRHPRDPQSVDQSRPARNCLYLLLGVCLFLATPRYSIAAAPSLVSQLQLPGLPSLIRATPDGRRVIVALGRDKGDKTQQVLVIDVDASFTPHIVGSFESDGQTEQLRLAPDGRHAALLARTTEAAAREQTHDLALWDLNNPTKPIKEWHIAIAGWGMDTPGRIAIARDAATYAFSRPSETESFHSQIVVGTVGGNRPDVLIEEDVYQPSLELSAEGSFLAIGRNPFAVGSAILLDLRAVPPVRYAQNDTTYFDRYQCMVALLASGHLVLEDRRAPRVGIYAPAIGIPKVSTISHGEGNSCSLADVDRENHSIVLSDDQTIRRIDVQEPKKPRIVAMWRLPAKITETVVAGNTLFAAKDNSNTLAVFRLDQVDDDASQVDWRSLDQAYMKVLADRTNSNIQRFERDFNAVTELQIAGVHQALAVAVKDITPKRAAAIFNDYGFLAAKIKLDRVNAELALRRAIQLDPDRAIAYLNLADLLRSRLSEVIPFTAKAAATQEVIALYRTYITKDGKKHGDIESYINAVDMPPDNMNTCEAVASYANSGRLGELIADSAIDADVNGHRIDFVSTTEGTSHSPTFYAFDADTDFPVSIAADMPWADELWGGDQLGLLLYHGTHIIHYRDAAHPVHTASLSGGPSCEFSSNVTEKVSADAAEPALCSDLIADTGPPSIDFEQPAPISTQAVQQRFAETSADNMTKIDFMNSGASVNVVHLGLSSGAGAGCDEELFDSVNETGDQLGAGPDHELLMKLQHVEPSNRYPILPCGNAARFFKYKGKVYFESKPAEWPPVDSWNQYHYVTRITDRRVEDVCHIKFAARVSVSVPKVPTQPPADE